MRLSKAFFATLRDDPRDAEVISHRLMARSHFIKKHGAGIYSYLPLLVRSLHKLEKIVREEFEKIDLQEVTMPYAIPGDLWKESGRWSKMGPELLRFKDRKDNDFCLGPTHEEVVVDLVRGQVNSYKQLPFTLYQITTKFRDEVRPRFGLMRGREFLMMDAYSFGANTDELNKTYDQIAVAYNRIFDRLGLNYVRVDADTGAIGGAASHEYHVLAQSGEDEILSAEDGSYGANVEKAPTPSPQLQSKVQGKSWGTPSDSPIEIIPTPGKSTIADVSKLLEWPAHLCVKTLVYQYKLSEKDGWKPVVVYIAGNRKLNEIKLKSIMAAEDIKVQEIVPMSEADVEKLFSAPVGFLGPITDRNDVLDALTYFDREVLVSHGLVCGANKRDLHLRNLEPVRDLAPKYPVAMKKNDLDLVMVEAGEVCPNSPEHAVYRSDRGIEVGHIFKLGSVYSKVLKAEFTTKEGKSAPFEMGCYGIGMTRTVAAAIEQNNDKDGIIWPKALAPYDVVLMGLGRAKDDDVSVFASSLYQAIKETGLSVIFDDRDMGPGIKFKDADLVGYPLRIVVGAKGLEKSEIEYSLRREPGEKLGLKWDGSPNFKDLANNINDIWNSI